MIKLSVYRKAVETNRKSYELMKQEGNLSTKQTQEMNKAIDDANAAGHELFEECGIDRSKPDSPARYEKQARILASVNRAGGVDWTL